MAHRRRNPVRPIEALRGISALFRDPDDTSQVFRIIRAVAGNSMERSFQRFQATETGTTILAEKRALIDRLNDRAYLESLPAGSLGRAYADFTATEDISPDGLVEASSDTPDSDVADCPERLLFGERLRDMHDLWHVVTGYGRDLIGEAGLLAFTYRQTRNRGIGLIVFVAYLRSGREFPQERVLIRDGLRRAKRAEWLPGADWEALLERPLEEVRQTLRVEPVGDYDGVRSQGAPALA
jgi:ubiquinone biosynthesis protein COQ4